MRLELKERSQNFPTTLMERSNFANPSLGQVKRRLEREQRAMLKELRPLGFLDRGWMKYAVLSFMWFMAVWLLLTYGMLIRAIQGKQAEVELINAWGMALVIELVGAAAAAAARARPPGASLLSRERDEGSGGWGCECERASACERARGYVERE